MTAAQLTALQALVGRDLTADEAAQVDAFIAADRNDAGVAALLSLGRTRQADTAIGIGDILDVLRGVGSGGGAFLDTLQALGQQDRDLHYVYVLLESGRLHINRPSVRAGMQQLAQAVPSLAPQIEALTHLGIEPDPLTVGQVSDALNAAGG